MLQLGFDNFFQTCSESLGNVLGRVRRVRNHPPSVFLVFASTFSLVEKPSHVTFFHVEFPLLQILAPTRFRQLFSDLLRIAWKRVGDDAHGVKPCPKWFARVCEHLFVGRKTQVTKKIPSRVSPASDPCSNSVSTTFFRVAHNRSETCWR